VELLDSPLIQAGLMIVAILLGVGVVVLRGTRKVAREDMPGIAGLLVRGEYEQAGNLAVRYGRFEDAIDYYLRAQQPVRAAHVAVKMSDARRAAELFERAGEHERAAFYYEQAGMADKGSELREEKADRPADEEPEDEPLQASPSRTGRLRKPDRADASDKEEVPPDRAGEADERPSGRDPEPDRPAPLATFDAIASAKAAGVGEREPRADAPEDGDKAAASAEAADALFAAGDIRGAADAYRDAGLFEEAINLYVNLLGLPEEAAKLLEKTGNPKRAAELRELANETAARKAPDEPEPAEPSPPKKEEAFSFGQPVDTPASPPPSPTSEEPAPSAKLPKGWQLPSSAGHASDEETLTRTSDPPPPMARPSDVTLGFGEKARNLVAQARAAYEASPVGRRRKRKQTGEAEPPQTDSGPEEPEPGKDERSGPAGRKGRSWSPPLSRTKQ
jgi:tetratricopeptide (TPR) repeat protein